MAVSPVATLNDDNERVLKKFLENFPTPTPLYHRQPASRWVPWVFWSQEDEGCCDEINSSSSSSSSSTGHHHSPIPYDKIKAVFSDLNCYYGGNYIVQWWAPVTIGGGRLVLSTSAQPFAINYIENDAIKRYRLRSMEYHFNIDQQLHIQQQQEIEEENEEEEEGNPIPTILISGGPAAAFLNRMPELVELKDHQGMMNPLARYALDCGLPYSCMLPICYPSHQTSSSSSPCIGVLEFTFQDSIFGFAISNSNLKGLVEKVGLSICPVQECIPYKTIHGLKPAKDDIEEALKIICGSHNLLLAQVWIAYADENHVPFSSSLEDTQMKRTIALKLTGYVDKDLTEYGDGAVVDYYGICDVVGLEAGEEIVEKTLQDYKPRFCRHTTKLNTDTLMTFATEQVEGCGVTICLRSIDTGDFDYAFEFLWYRTSNDVILLEALLLTLKRCLPSFKFASGVELGDQLEVQLINDRADSDAENSTDSETESFTIFQGKKSSPVNIALKEGKNPIVVDSCKAKWKTAPKELPREDIEQQFGKTMKKAAENLKVSLSTLKRKCKDYHIYEWQGPNFLKKGKVDASSSDNQSNRNIEEDNTAIQEPSVVNRMENTLTIKAECADDTIKFDLDISEATFVNVEKEIGANFNLAVGTYKLNYRDEDGDWILLGSDQHMKYCIKRLRNLGQTVVRLRVLPFPQRPTSYE